MEEEIWKDIPDAEGYQASDKGRIRSWWGNSGRLQNAPHVMRPSIQSNGYLYLHVKFKGKRKYVSVHSLVLMAFVGPRPEGLIGCHNKNDIMDNRPENLRWDTYKANAEDRRKDGTQLVGEDGTAAVLTEVEVMDMRRRKRGGETVYAIWNSIGRKVTRRTLTQAVRGDTWSHLPDPVFVGPCKPKNIKRGAESHSARLSYDIADNIRAMYAECGNKTAVAKATGHCWETVSWIVDNLTWVRPNTIPHSG